MSYIDIRDLGTLQFYHSGSGSVTISSGSNSSTESCLEMDVLNSDSTGKTSVSIMTPQYGGLSFTGSFMKGTDGYSPYMFYPFCGRNLFLYLTNYSTYGYYSGNSMSMGYGHSTRFNGRAVFLITPYYSSLQSSSSSSSPTPSGSIKITSGTSTSPTNEKTLDERTGIVFGYLIIEAAPSASPWITVSYLNSSSTWNTAVTKSFSNYYYQVTCTNCILNRIV